jgi:hypothetical protein
MISNWADASSKRPGVPAELVRVTVRAGPSTDGPAWESDYADRRPGARLIRRQQGHRRPRQHQMATQRPLERTVRSFLKRPGRTKDPGKGTVAIFSQHEYPFQGKRRIRGRTGKPRRILRGIQDHKPTALEFSVMLAFGWCLLFRR